MCWGEGYALHAEQLIQICIPHYLTFFNLPRPATATATATATTATV